ncbi:MAG: MAPEG family protein [Rhodobacteraceae bacterium]|nr:MAPEG family protein [Paracoccaceae bacterium]
MPVEVEVLAYAVLLAVAQLFLFAIPANLTIGSRYLAGPRDGGVKLEGVPARLQRAFLNHIEGLVLFMAAVVVVTLGDASSNRTETAAWVYLTARIVYVPLYAAGTPYVRSLVWATGFIATLSMVVVALGEP